jgi:hypothetical protein
MKVSMRSGKREGEGETSGREGREDRKRTEEKEGKRGEWKRGVG